MACWLCRCRGVPTSGESMHSRRSRDQSPFVSVCPKILSVRRFPHPRGLVLYCYMTLRHPNATSGQDPPRDKDWSIVSRTNRVMDRLRNSITYVRALYHLSSIMIDGRGTDRVFPTVLGPWESSAPSVGSICADLVPSVANPTVGSWEKVTPSDHWTRDIESTNT